MNHNKYNLEVGEIVILDAKYNNHSKVIIKSFTDSFIYANVYPIEMTPNDSWKTMTTRLTPIEKEI